MKRLAEFLYRFHNQKRPLIIRIVSLVFGAITFLLILPACSIFIGRLGKGIVSFTAPRYLEWIITVPCLAIGLIFLAWATYALWTIGKGTPLPYAPTQRLIVSGPYKLCRNPIELGAIFYYTGIGTLYDGMEVGLICALLALVAGSLYHKLVEERELEMRFGSKYQDYKERIPFLIPKLRNQDQVKMKVL